MNINNLKLGAKALLPIALMAAIVVAMVAFGGFKLSGVSSTASDIIERRTVGTLEIDRARVSVVNIVYDVFGELTFDSGGPRARRPRQVSPTRSPRGRRASTKPPHCCRRRPTRSRNSRRDSWRSSTRPRRRSRSARTTPSLETGRKLKPEELDQMAAGAKLLAAVDVDVRALADESEDFHARHARRERQVRRRAAAAIAQCAVDAGARRPRRNARRRRRRGVDDDDEDRPSAVAARRGDGSAGVGRHGGSRSRGSDRRDEIGDMSRAVDVFKQNALDRARLEAEAASGASPGRNRARARGGASAPRRPKEQTEAVQRLGDGLRGVAGGDLTVRLDRGLHAGLRQDSRRLQRRRSTSSRRRCSPSSSSTGAIADERQGSDGGGRRSVAPHRGAGRQPRGDDGDADRGDGDGEEVGRRDAARAPSRRGRRRERQEERATSCARRSRRWAPSPSRRSRSARSSASSTRSLSRPIFWRSTPASRRRAPATQGAASPSSPRKCAPWRSARRKRPRKSRG